MLSARQEERIDNHRNRLKAVIGLEGNIPDAQLSDFIEGAYSVDPAVRFLSKYGMALLGVENGHTQAFIELLKVHAEPNLYIRETMRTIYDIYLRDSEIVLNHLRKSQDESFLSYFFQNESAERRPHDLLGDQLRDILHKIPGLRDTLLPENTSILDFSAADESFESLANFLSQRFSKEPLI